ncbi:hypothetical protein ABIC27_005712 [Streptomyces sp. PvR034]
MRGGRRGGQGFGVAEPLGLGGQLDVLAGQRLHGRDLLQAEAQQVRLLGPLPGPGGDRVQFAGHRPQPPVGGRVLLQRDRHRVTGVPVEGLALARGAHQALLVGLPVDGDQVVRQLAEQADGHRAAAHVGSGTSLRGDRTADQQGAVVQLGPGLLGPQRGGSARAQHDPALDDRGLGPDPYERRVGPSAEQEPEARDDHRLARTGLARHRGETGRQLDHRVVDDSERPYPHLLKHAPDDTEVSRAPCAVPAATALGRARSDEHVRASRCGRPSGAPRATPTPGGRTSRRGGR